MRPGQSFAKGGVGQEHILHDDPEVRFFEEGAMVLGDIWRIELAENLDLLLDIFDLVFGGFEVDDLDGNDFLGNLFVAEREVVVGLSDTDKERQHAPLVDFTK